MEADANESERLASAASDYWERRAKAAEAELAIARQPRARAGLDGCYFCLGYRGGRPETMKIRHGARLCVICAELFDELAEIAQRTAVVMPAADPSDNTLVMEATRTAHDHAAAESRGDLVSLTTPVRVEADGSLSNTEVEDPDELEMYRQLEARNIAVCGWCYNTGYDGGMADATALVKLCTCPVGDFVKKKLATPEAP